MNALSEPIAKLGTVARAIGPRAAEVFYRILSPVYSREMRAVAAGIRKYRDGTRGAGPSPGLVYKMRRNIHMLEKGLSMEPRRETFAVEYISETVAGYNALVQARSAVGHDELSWYDGVLEAYFRVASGSQEIEFARSEFGRARFVSATKGMAPGPLGDVDSPVDIQDFEALALRRKSVRWFEQKSVPRVQVDRAIAVAREAPTACNRQPYRFLVLDEGPELAKVASIPMGTRGYAHQIPGLIVVVGDLSAYFDERDRHLIYIDASLAAMALIFALEAQGVSSCCINWPDIPERERRMARELRLAEYERVVMLIGYGYGRNDGVVPYSQKANGSGEYSAHDAAL